MRDIIETFRRYGLPVIGGGALVGAFMKGMEAMYLSLTSAERSAYRAESDISCYLGIIAILCGIGYFVLRPDESINTIESHELQE